jgi:hypothetical protein
MYVNLSSYKCNRLPYDHYSEWSWWLAWATPEHHSGLQESLRWPYEGRRGTLHRPSCHMGMGQTVYVCMSTCVVTTASGYCVTTVVVNGPDDWIGWHQSTIVGYRNLLDGHKKAGEEPYITLVDPLERVRQYMSSCEITTASGSCRWPLWWTLVNLPEPLGGYSFNAASK